MARLTDRARVLWQDWSRDALHALRGLQRAPQFTAVVAITLALGIGGNAAVFTVINAVLFRPLPYERSEQLVQLWTNLADPPNQQMTVSPADYLDWRRARSFSDIAAHNLWFPALGTPDGADRILAELVTPNLFAVLGVKPALGRGFLENEGLDTKVAVLSWGAWQRRYGGERNILDRSIRLNGDSYTVVGVLPASYRHPDPHRPLEEPELYVPINFRASATDRASLYLRTVGRLRAGATIESARAEFATIAQQLKERYPETNRLRTVTLIPLRENFFGALRKPLLIALAAAGLVLLVACANIGNLVLARSQSRRREFAIRTAIGAGQYRLARQLITESFFLSFFGGVLGLGLVIAGTGALRGAVSQFLPVLADVRVDRSVIVFTALACTVTAVLFGLAPLVQLRRTELRQLLSEGSAGAGESRRTQHLRAALVVAQVTLAVALVVATGLLTRSLLNVRNVNTGFASSAVLTFDVSLPSFRYSDREKVQQFHNELRRRLSALPGVDTAALVGDLPLSSGNRSIDVRRIDRATPFEQTEFESVTPGYFEAMQVPLIAGRVYADADLPRGRELVVVSQSLAHHLWPEGNALGAQITAESRPGEAPPKFTVIGVVGDVLDDALTGAPDPTMYFLTTYQASTLMSAVLRTNIPASTISAAARNVVREMDPEVPVANVRPLSALVQERRAPQRFAAVLASAFAFLALALASLGIYGVLAYAVAARTREIGIRSVLGANARFLQRMVVRNALMLVVPGVVLGLAIDLAATRVISGLLYGVSGIDPLSYLVAAAVLPLVAVFASIVPARRATRIQPLEALRP